MYNRYLKAKYIIQTSLTLICLIFVWTNSAMAQAEEVKPKQQWKMAEQLLISENYEDAYSIYSDLFKANPDNHHLAFKLGYIQIIREENQDVQAAIDYLLMASENTHKSYKNKFKETKAPLNTLYYLGIAFRLNEQYENAIDAFTRFKNNMSRKDKKTIQGKFTDREIQSCKDAMDFIDTKYMKIGKIEVVDLEDPSIRCPIICEEANRLIFTNGKYNLFPPDVNYNREQGEGQFDPVFMAKRNENGIFHSPVNISEGLEISYPYIPVTATADGSELYFIVDEGDNGQIYMSLFEEDKYQKAEPVKCLNTKKWESHASIAPDGSRIYFTSNRKGGYGGLDIWFADRNEDGSWEKAINLGPDINTKYHEEMPYISKDGKNLLFSSEGHRNIGGFDVFWSKFDTENKIWLMPENLGYPYSTIGNDMGYFIENPPHFSFCPINDNKRRQGVEDCECISVTEEAVPKLADLSGLVEIEESNSTLSGNYRLKAVNVDTNNEMHNVEINTDGTFSIDGVEPGTYNLIVYNDEEYVHSMEFTVPTNHDGLIEDINIIIPQTSLITGTTDDNINTDIDKEDSFGQNNLDGHIHIRSILFERDSFIVRDSYEEDLTSLAKFLKENPDSKIELHAYCSQTGSFQYNKRLGQKRAESVKNLLTENGVDENQISLINHVQDSPIAIGDHPDSRIYNQRVDVKAIANADVINNVPVYVPTYYRKDQVEYNYSNGTFFYPHSEVISEKIIIEPVLFDFDKYSIKSVHYENLDKIAEYLKTYPNAQIKFSGHTDHYGSEEYNINLSKQRVNSVKTYLVNKGVNENQILTEYKGENQPITVLIDNDNIRRLNRRVDNSIIKTGEGKIISMPINVPDKYKR